MHRRRRLAASATALAASALLLAACGSSKPSTSSTTKTKTTTSGKPTYGGTVAWAEPAGASPNYIFPVNPVQYQSVANLTDFQPLMYQGLFTSYFGEPAIDYADSIGNKPVWSDNDTVVTITLKHEKWSDGTPITTRDITFYINLAKSLGANWGDYTPGDFPYNVKKITVLGPYKIQFTLDKSYNPTWYVDNQLGDIVPIPQQAWDKESVNGTIGNYDETTAGAKAVWSFLNKQAGDTSTYATNPLWQVVDGPWRLSSYGGASSPTVFVPKKK
jgi:peptide/nickel transport system substrate-binding protein